MPLPLLTLDLDGVICRPVLGQNVGIHATFLDPLAEPPPARVYPSWLNAPLDHLRFDFRRPMPGVHEALRELGRRRRLVIVTGRRTPPTRWLRHHGLDALVDDVVVNRTGLRSPHYKLAALREIGATEHVEDDPRTAQLLAQAGSVRVYLCTWPRNVEVAFDPGVERVADLGDLARRLRTQSGQPD
ncbi:MAG: hypothetical protein WD734_06075 [Dehalococcoidia bacterium]